MSTKFWKDGEIRFHKNETIDEIVCSCKYFHLEDLGLNGIWIGVYGENDEQLLHINITKSKETLISAEIEDIEPKKHSDTLKKHCAICNELQYESPSGTVCKNGHGGAPALEDLTPEEAAKILVKFGSVFMRDTDAK